MLINQKQGPQPGTKQYAAAPLMAMDGSRGAVCCARCCCQARAPGAAHRRAGRAHPPWTRRAAPRRRRRRASRRPSRPPPRAGSLPAPATPALQGMCSSTSPETGVLLCICAPYVTCAQRLLCAVVSAFGAVEAVSGRLPAVRWHAQGPQAGPLSHPRAPVRRRADMVAECQSNRKEQTCVLCVPQRWRRRPLSRRRSAAAGRARRRARAAARRAACCTPASPETAARATRPPLRGTPRLPGLAPRLSMVGGAGRAGANTVAWA